MEDIKSKEWIKDYIVSLIDEVKHLSAKERDCIPFRVQMARKHDTFFSKFPSLLMLILDQGSDFDLKKLDEMLILMDNIHSGDKDLEEVNKKMGQEFFDKHIAPNIDMKKENS